MAAFGDASLFAEFERGVEPSDKILLSKFQKEVEGNHPLTAKNGKEWNSDEDEEENSVDFQIGSENSDFDVRDGSDPEKSGSETHTSRPTGSSKEDRSDCTKNWTLDGEMKKIQGLQADINTLRKVVSKLETERNRLSKQCRIIKPVRNNRDREGPALQIVYMNHVFSRRQRNSIEGYVAHLLNQDRNYQEKLGRLDLRNSVCVADEEDNSHSDDQMSLMDSATVIGCSQMYEDFAVDAMGWPLVQLNPALTECWDIPIYLQQFLEALPVDAEEEDKAEMKREKKAKGSCFNCGGDHTLNECSQPRDHRQIAEKRKQFMKDFQGPKSRYHADEDPRFMKYKAGVMSDDLRDALGLRKNQLAPFIYQMRLLGYPPGHLETTKLEQSGISMFDKHGKEVSLEGDAMEGEDGEVDLSDSFNAAEGQYDVSRIVSFPGFNVELQEDIVDEHEQLGMPPMQPQHRKEVLELYLSSQQTPGSAGGGVKRSRNRPGGRGSPKKQRTTPRTDSDTTDMDVDDDTDPRLRRQERGDMGSYPSSRGSLTTGPGSVGGSRPETPSLEDLEAQRQYLQMQLEAVEGSSGAELQVLDSCEGEDDANSSFIPPLPPTPVRPPLPANTPPVTPGSPSLTSSTPKGPFAGLSDKLRSLSSPKLNASSPSPPPPPRTPTSEVRTPGSEACTPSLARNTSTSSLSMSFGTPIADRGEDEEVMMSTDSLKGLPNAYKFSQGVSEHIPYENLPGATGTFQRMQSVLKKLRSAPASSSSQS